MADFADDGSAAGQQFNETALAKHLACRQVLNRPSAVECQECGDLIPRERREKVPGCKYCTPCQELDEKGLL